MVVVLLNLSLYLRLRHSNALFFNELILKLSLISSFDITIKYFIIGDPNKTRGVNSRLERTLVS